MHHILPLDETVEQILEEQEPNLLRLYLNPHVAQTCFCLDRYVRTTWTIAPASSGQKQARALVCQSFLANSLEEALSGALKLVRSNLQTVGPGSTGLILDPADRLAAFVSVDLADGQCVEFLPGLRILGKSQLGHEPGTLRLEGAFRDVQNGAGATGINPLVLVSGGDHILDRHAEAICRLVRRETPMVITCVDRATVASLRNGSSGIIAEIVPDIVVFDESFVDHAVPFSAFTARQSLFACWNEPGKATFHSTTFQPNTTSTLHFMRCLALADPEFYGRYRDELQVVLTDLSRRGDWFRRYYNPALYRLIRASGFNTKDVRAAGSFIVANGRSIFDTVGGVACSIRGHNPASYADEMKMLVVVPGQQSGGDVSPSAGATPTLEAELRRRLRNLTGLEFVLPAVSGATAVENALKVALVAQFPKRHILALKAGFGGKTLLALTGTANPSYKEHIDPLYADVHYVDPFASDARAQIDRLLDRHEFAVVQVELIQSVGGVRPIPESLIGHLDAGRKRWGYLLLVDEVQTGMYRTGPFIRSQACGVAPDLLLLGKGTSDMMFPFALTLHTAGVQDMLERQGSDLTDLIRRHYGYEQGYKTVLNILQFCATTGMTRQVVDAGALFAQLLTTDLAGCKNVRDVRVFGLLIGIELDTRRWPQRWLAKRLSALYLLGMLRHEHFPVLAGLCQYEPGVLKITPPLNASHDEIRQACATIVEVLRRPLHRVLAVGLSGLIQLSSVRKKNDEYRNDTALEPAAL
jgi:acetylornithine/succinyldiaminopimelate/putrescine aminotransferase